MATVAWQNTLHGLPKWMLQHQQQSFHLWFSGPQNGFVSIYCPPKCSCYWYPWHPPISTTQLENSNCLGPLALAQGAHVQSRRAGDTAPSKVSPRNRRRFRGEAWERTLSCGVVEPPKISNCHWGSSKISVLWLKVKNLWNHEPFIPQTKAIG